MLVMGAQRRLLLVRRRGSRLELRVAQGSQGTGIAVMSGRLDAEWAIRGTDQRVRRFGTPPPLPVAALNDPLLK